MATSTGPHRYERREWIIQIGFIKFTVSKQEVQAEPKQEPPTFPPWKREEVERPKKPDP